MNRCQRCGLPNPEVSELKAQLCIKQVAFEKALRKITVLQKACKTLEGRSL